MHICDLKSLTSISNYLKYLENEATERKTAKEVTLAYGFQSSFDDNKNFRVMTLITGFHRFLVTTTFHAMIRLLILCLTSQRKTSRIIYCKLQRSTAAPRLMVMWNSMRFAERYNLI